MDINLKQSGRARIDFAAELGAIQAQLTAAVDKQVAAMDLPDDLDAQVEQVRDKLDRYIPGWFLRQIKEWSSTHHGKITHHAFDEIRLELMPEFERLSRGPTRIESSPDMVCPDYWQGVEFHRTTGGWEREHQGFIHGELIHPLYIGKKFPGQIFKQRAQVLEELGDRPFSRILEMGTSSGHYSIQIARRYPDAELTGVELSLPMLQQAQRVANENNLKWCLIQAAAEATGLPDSSFDLVTSYILLHELPTAVTRQVFEEGLRLLEPGGMLLMSDVRPFRDMTRLEQWRSYSDSLYGGEPYWREAASLDLAQLAAKTGFVNARSYGLGERHYPWVTIAQKPE